MSSYIIYDQMLRESLYTFLTGDIETEWEPPSHLVIGFIVEAFGVAGMRLEHHIDHPFPHEDCYLGVWVWGDDSGKETLAWTFTISMGTSVYDVYTGLAGEICEDVNNVAEKSEVLAQARQKFIDCLQGPPWGLYLVRAVHEDVMEGSFVVAKSSYDAERFLEEEQDEELFVFTAVRVTDLPEHLWPDSPVPVSVTADSELEDFVATVMRDMENEPEKYLQ